MSGLLLGARMTECNQCGQELSSGSACTSDTVVIDDMDHLRVRLGEERPLKEPLESCPDCGTPAGGVHHVRCGFEQCPLCREPLRACDCRKAPPFHREPP